MSNVSRLQLMLDIETLGTIPGCAIASIAIIPFHIEIGIHEPPYPVPFKSGVSIISCQELGLKIDAKALTFWLLQDKEAQKELLHEVSLVSALRLMNEWFLINKLQDTPIWCHGPSFDIVILEAAFKICGYQGPPWKYNSPRDTRTIYDLADLDIKQEKREGTFHNASDDCMFQIRMVQKAWKKLVSETL